MRGKHRARVETNCKNTFLLEFRFLNGCWNFSVREVVRGLALERFRCGLACFEA